MLYQLSYGGLGVLPRKRTAKGAPLWAKCGTGASLFFVPHLKGR